MKHLFILSILFLLPISLIAQNSAAERQQAFNLGNNHIALKAYDPVSYFTEEEPLKCKKDLYSDHNGVRYHFYSEASKAAFDENPDRYEPAYGGYCAYAVGNGYTADANPKTYKIIDDKLYVFYNNGLINTLKKWNKKEQELYPASIENWSGILDKLLGR